MAIKSKEELISSITERLQGDNSDDALALLEDVSDTLDDYDTKLNDSTDWKQKYEDNDKEWREKYKTRFINGSEFDQEFEKENTKDKQDENEIEKAYTFSELFKNE